MKNIFILLVFIFVWEMEGTTQAQAFYMQDSIEFIHPDQSPYPNVVSQPLDVLPQGFVTVNAGHETYYYCGGIFYQKTMRDQKYVAVPAPIGAVVFTIPQGYQLILVDGESFYEDQGIYYKRVLEGYKVVYPPRFF